MLSANQLASLCFGVVWPFFNLKKIPIYYLSYLWCGHWSEISAVTTLHSFKSVSLHSRVLQCWRRLSKLRKGTCVLKHLPISSLQTSAPTRFPVTHFHFLRLSNMCQAIQPGNLSQLGPDLWILSAQEKGEGGGRFYNAKFPKKYDQRMECE